MTGRWFSPGPLVSSTNKTDCHDITEIVLKMALSTINLNLHHYAQKEMSPPTNNWGKKRRIKHRFMRKPTLTSKHRTKNATTHNMAQYILNTIILK